MSQFVGGVLQGLGGGGFDNTINAAATLGVGATLGRAFAVSKGFRSASQRRTERFLKNTGTIAGGLFDLSVAIGTLAPRHASCKELSM